jgi:alpha-L-fucosidase 2
MHPNRRETLIGAAMAAIASGRAYAQVKALPAADGGADSGDVMVLRYDRPAVQWTEALPIGNGRLGAMVFGNPQAERLQLNEDTLWSGGPYDAVNPKARVALPQVQKLIFEDRCLEAQDLADEMVMGRPLRQMVYQALGDLVIEQPGLGQVSDYHRTLDIDAAIASVSFSSGATRFSREMFASVEDQAIIVTLRADKPGALDFDIKLDGMQLDAQPELGFASPLIAGETEETAQRYPGPQQWQVSGDRDELILSGQNSSHNGVKGALRFCARLRMVAKGGARQAGANVLSVRGADEVTLYLAAATSYRRFDDTGGDPVAATRRVVEAVAAKPLARVRATHISAHRALFRRVTLDLGSTPAANQTTSDRVAKSAYELDPSLVTLYFQFGRYLMLSSSRPGSQPANLQGIWNDRLAPPWGSKWTLNINAEMNYWLAEQTALPECIEPLVRMIEDLAITGTHTAREMYGARGWVAHHNTDLWRATAPCDGATWGLWPTGGAWLCKHLWDRFDFGRDPAFLARAYPLMKGAALFFVDTLVVDPRTGWLVTCPSNSPENTHPLGTTLCAGPTMDMQILRDLFANTIAAAELLGADEGLRAIFAAKYAKLAPNKIGKAGQLQEWQQDWDLLAPEINHRHVAHLYGLHPSNQIDAYATPELWRAARRSIEIRGDEATGWGIAWRLLFWARLLDGDHAYRVLRSLLAPEHTYPDLLDICPPFMIDANFGGTAGIAELFIQSPPGEIRLLPALPTAFSDGAVAGLRARGGFEVDVVWAGGALKTARLRSIAGEPVLVRYGSSALRLATRKGQEITLVAHAGILAPA